MYRNIPSISYRHTICRIAHSYPITATISSMLEPKGHHLSNGPLIAAQTAYSKYYRMHRMHYLLQNSMHADSTNIMLRYFYIKSIYEM